MTITALTRNTDIFAKYIMDPDCQSTPLHRALAWITTIALGILALGAIHAACAIYQSCRPVTSPNHTHAAIARLFHQTFHPIDISRIRTIADRDGFVWFYDAATNSCTQCFGNFYEDLDRVLGCRTAEGAFHAMKFGINPQDPRNPFANLSGPDVYHASRNYEQSHAVVQGWHGGGRYQAMTIILRDKFKPGTQLAQALLATGSAHLVEHRPSINPTPHGEYWSDNYNGSGTNALGQCLMDIRQELGGWGRVPPSAQALTWYRSLPRS